jgi:hypothetical protein
MPLTNLIEVRLPDGTTKTGIPVRGFVEVTCEGPRCARGSNGQPFRISWDPEKAKTDETEMPDEAWRITKVVNFIGQEHLFCCTRCRHDWDLDNPFTLKSPRELAAQQAAEQEIQAKRIAKEREEATPAVEGDPA